MRQVARANLVNLWLCGVAACSGASEDASGRDDTADETAVDDAAAPSPSVGVNEPTYFGAVAPILAKHCIDCHQEDKIGGFALNDPEEVAKLAPAIAFVTKSRTMPPMPVNNDGSCNLFKNARWLSDSELQTLERWSNAGAPLGEPAAAAQSGARAGDPALAGEIVSFDLGVDYSPQSNAGKADDYHCFVVDPIIETDSFLTAYKIEPGDTRIVHHVALFSIVGPEAEADRALDSAEDGPGYTCYGAPGRTAISMIGSWTPGGGAIAVPSGTGIRLKAGQKLIVQMHYNLPQQGGPFTDRSKMSFQMSRDPALVPAFFLPIGSEMISLPPGLEHTEASDGDIPLAALGEHFALPPFNGWKAWGVLPHMHTAGKTLIASTKTGDNRERCLTHVDRWDFHWQDTWWYETPIEIGAASSINVTCGYDTRGRVRTTVAGEGTDDEMCFNALYITLY